MKELAGISDLVDDMNSPKAEAENEMRANLAKLSISDHQLL